jgi:hypothetical protein
VSQRREKSQEKQKIGLIVWLLTWPKRGGAVIKEMVVTVNGEGDGETLNQRDLRDVRSLRACSLPSDLRGTLRE